MRYANTIPAAMALLDLPTLKYDQVNLFKSHKIFRQLLVLDHIADIDWEKVTKEAILDLNREDVAFEEPFLPSFAHYLTNPKYMARWHKIRQDYNHYIKRETRRRNLENPYHNPNPNSFPSWDSLPDFSRQKLNQPWQFDNLCKDAQRLSGAIYEFVKNYENQEDKDVFRLKVNGVLAPERIIFALNSSENIYNFVEREISVVNIKLSLGAYKLSYLFNQRIIESLHKLSWSADESKSRVMSSLIESADGLSEKLKKRIEEIEKRLMLFLEYDPEELEEI